MNKIVSSLRKKIIVAIDATPDDPCNQVEFKVAMAGAVQTGGAGALRVGGSEVIKAVSSAVEIPLIGFIKLDHPDYSVVRVTPTFENACQAVEAGADLLALELTDRIRSDGLTDEKIVYKIKDELNVPIVADISTYEEALKAQDYGVDIIATTLVGYTPQSRKKEGYDFELLEKLCNHLDKPVFAEGHIATPEEAQKAIQMGAYAVVVGSMISRPHMITEKFASEINKALEGIS